RDDGGLRILLRCAEHDVLQRLPWELMHDGSWPLALNPATPLARYIEMPRPVRVPRRRGRLRVLYTSACPPGSPALDLATEEAKVRSALKSIAGLDLEIDNQVTPTLLQRLLHHAETSKKPFHVWHHAGHGRLDEQGAFYLDLNGREAGAAEVSRM